MQDAPFRLFVIWAPDCPACAATKPEAWAWAAAHPWVRLIPFNIVEQEWRANWTPKITPTLIILTPQGRRHYREGHADQADITAWLERVAPAALVRPRAKDAVIDASKEG